jgi:hypothetical protein
MHPITQAIQYWLEKGNEKAASQLWHALEAEMEIEETTAVHKELAALDLIPALLAALKK